MLTFCAQNWTFKNRKSARFSSVLRELKGFHKVYMPLATRNFKNIILLILKDKVASTACVFFRCTKLFSHKNKVAPPPKARDFRRFFHWIFCTTPMFDVELSTVGKLFLHAFQRYQARYLKRPWCNCPTVFLLRKSQKIAKIALFHRSSAQSTKNKTSRFQHRNASAHSAKNKTSRFQHRNV